MGVLGIHDGNASRNTGWHHCELLQCQPAASPSIQWPKDALWLSMTFFLVCKDRKHSNHKKRIIHKYSDINNLQDCRFQIRGDILKVDPLFINSR